MKRISYIYTRKLKKKMININDLYFKEKKRIFIDVYNICVFLIKYLFI